MAAHRIFCTLNTLSEIVRLRKERPYSTVYSVIEKLGDLYLDCEVRAIQDLGSTNPIIKKLCKRSNRNIFCEQSWKQAIKSPQADDIFLLLPPDSRPFVEYRKLRGILLTYSLTDMQIIDDLATIHYRPYSLITDDEKKNLKDNDEEYEDISTWKDVFSPINIAPINSAIITDNFLFSADNFLRRKSSLYDIIQSLVPSGLAFPFHLTIFTYNQDGKLLKNNLEQVIQEICELKLGSKIKVSIVAHTSKEVTHDRYILTNYHIITSGRGFGVIDFRGIKVIIYNVTLYIATRRTCAVFNFLQHRFLLI